MTRPIQLNRGLVGAWCPSLGNTGLRLYDRTVRKNHGTLTNMTAATAWVKSGGKGALSFDGTDDFVTAGFTPNSTSRTVSLWYTFRGTGSFSILYSGGEGNTGQAVQIYLQGNSLLVVSQWGAVVSLTIATNDSVWRNCTVINTANEWQIWINATLRQTGTMTTNPGRFSARIGAQTTTPLYSHNGEIDDFRIYNRALTPSEIRQLYIGGRGFGLLPERPRRRSKAAAAAFNRRRRILTAG